MVASFSFLFNYYIVYVHRILLHYSTPSQLSWYLFKTRIFLHKIKEIGYQKKRFDVVDSDQLTHGRLFNYYTVYVHRILLLHSFVSIETVETKECMNILCRIIKQVVMNRFCCEVLQKNWAEARQTILDLPWQRVQAEICIHIILLRRPPGLCPPKFWLIFSDHHGDPGARQPN